MLLKCSFVPECVDVLLECIQKNDGWDILLALRCCSWQLNHVVNVECINQFLYLDPLPFPVCERLQKIPLCEVWKQAVQLHNEVTDFEQRYENLVQSIASTIHQIANPMIPITSTNVHSILVNVGQNMNTQVYDRLRQDKRFIGIDAQQFSDYIELKLRNGVNRCEGHSYMRVQRSITLAPVEVNF